MAYTRQKTDAELQWMVDAICEVVADYEICPQVFDAQTWCQLCKQFSERAIWIRNGWNVAAACKWLRAKLTVCGFKERGLTHDD